MLPVSIGTNVFNPINNAHIMNSRFRLEHRVDSRQACWKLHASSVMPSERWRLQRRSALQYRQGVELLPFESSRVFYIEGFELSTLVVVGILLFGALLVYFQRPSRSTPGVEPASGGDG